MGRGICARAGVKAGEFLAAYSLNQQQGIQVEVENSPVAQAVLELLQSDPTPVIEATATDLLSKLNALRGHDKPNNWPKDAARLSGEIKRIAPALRKMGVAVELNREGRRRSITLHYDPSACDVTSDADDDGYRASVTKNIASQSHNDADDADDAIFSSRSTKRKGEREESEIDRRGDNSVTSVTVSQTALTSHKNGDAESVASVTPSVTRVIPGKLSNDNTPAARARRLMKSHNFTAARAVAREIEDKTERDIVMAEIRYMEEVQP